MLSSTGAVLAREYGALAHRLSERLLTRQKDGNGRERSDCDIQSTGGKGRHFDTVHLAEQKIRLVVSEE